MHRFALRNFFLTGLIACGVGCGHDGSDVVFDKKGNPAGGTQVQTQSNGQAPQPTYSPVQGLYNSSQSVTLSTSLTGATVCYSTTATTPDCDSATGSCTAGTTYSVPLNVSTTTTLKSIACKVSYFNSALTSGTYTIDTTAPGTAASFTATAGDTTILLSWTNPGDADLAGIKILRKTGSYPASNSDGTVVFNGSGTSFVDTGLTNATQYYYGAYAFDTAGNFAVTAQATATPSAGAVNAPTFSPGAATFNAGQNVTISTTTGGTIICYTTNGTNPSCNATPTCTAGTQYAAAVAIPATATLKALACNAGNTSGITTGNYTIDTTAPVISAVAPASASTANSTQVSYTLSENCATASVTWTQTGGTSDGSSPHVQALSGSELTSGTHTGITLVNNPTLVQNSIYSIAFNCSDAAGNSAATVTSTAVTFDSLPPGNVTGLTAIKGDAKVTLVWTNPGDSDFAGVKILRKTGSYPVNNTDGTVIYNSTGTNVADTGLANGTQYYYKAFAYDTAGSFASGTTATATPSAPCGGGSCRIFVTATNYSGNLGGAAGADAKCNADAAKPNASTYKALISDATRRACTAAACGGAAGVEQSLDWVFFPSKNYVRSDGTTAVGTTNANAIFPGTTLTASITTGAATQIWTGIASTPTWTTDANTCTNWSDASGGGLMGSSGTSNSATISTAFWNLGGVCSGTKYLYCVEQ